MRFGSNAEFFVAEEIPTFDGGVIDFDLLPSGDTTIGYVYGGLATNAAHVFGNLTALSSASGEIFAVVLTKPVPEPASLLQLALAISLVMAVRRRTVD